MSDDAKPAPSQRRTRPLSGRDSATEQDRDTDPSADELVPVAVAAEAAGVTVAAIRKWYRAGIVESIEVPGVRGTERRVNVAQAITRANATRRPSGPAYGPPAAAEAPPAPSQALVPMSELSGLFDRLADAESRAIRAELEAEHRAELLEQARADAEQARAELEQLRAAPPAPAPRRRWWQGAT